MIFSFKSIDEIEFAKALTTLYDVGSIAIGFATAGASELILDAADFAFGFRIKHIVRIGTVKFQCVLPTESAVFPYLHEGFAVSLQKVLSKYLNLLFNSQVLMNFIHNSMLK